MLLAFPYAVHSPAKMTIVDTPTVLNLEVEEYGAPFVPKLDVQKCSSIYSLYTKWTTIFSI